MTQSSPVWWQVFNEQPELLLAILVVALDWLLPLKTKISLEWLFSQFASAIKMKLRLSRADLNLSLYGGLATAFFLTFIGIILFALLFAFPVDHWTNAALLYLCLSYSRTRHISKDLIPMLHHKQKIPARTLLNASSQWNALKLSELGLLKLCIELLTQRLVHGLILPLLCYFLFGGVGCVLYLAMFTAYQHWFVEQHHKQLFVQFMRRLIDLLAIPLSGLFAILFSVFKTSPGWLKLYRANRAEWTASGGLNADLLWLSITAAGLRCELLGPVMLGDNKITRARVNYRINTSTVHVAKLLVWQRRFVGCLLLLMTLFWCLLITQ